MLHMQGFLRCFKAVFPVLAALVPAVLPAQTAGQRSRLGLNTVVIDPGHGGHDPGGVSKDGRTKEKNLTLDISRRLEQRIRSGCPDVKVLKTRDYDVFVPLVKRAKIANEANADLFISVHVNSVSGTAANGYSVHVLGQSSVEGRDLYSNNFNECARENSVILLEEDYSTNYQGYDPNDPESSILFSLMQNAYLEQSLMFADDVNRSLLGGPFAVSKGVHQDPFLVLWKTAMPAVLLECGFISNADDLKVLRTDAKLDKLADCLYEAFLKFKADYDRSIDVHGPAAGSAEPGSDSKAAVSEKPAQESGAKAAVSEKPAQESGAKTAASGKQEPEPGSAKTASVWYGTQILALSRLLPDGDPAFKGYEAEAIHDGDIYRYVAGRGSTLESARKKNAEIRKKFPDSFLVWVSPEGKIERIR